MRIELKNIGMLEEASVKIDGLTVIAGENDAGKSTVGKVLFCIIKSISKYKDFRKSSTDKIEDILDELFFLSRRYAFDDIAKYESIRNTFHITLYNKIGEENPDIYIEKLNTEIINISSEKEFTNHANFLIGQIQYIINTPEDRRQLIENALNKVFISEFDSSILNHNSDSGYIKLYEDERILLDTTITKDNKINLNNKVEPIEISEATFIETPLILNNHDMLIRSQTGLNITKRRSRSLGLPYTTLHTKDLFDKLKSRNYELYLEAEFENQTRSDISKIINGEIIYDDKERDFIYIKNGQKISIKNTATGIKTFGIIQLLIDSGFIAKNELLVLDEPEVHLHPKWQLKYAQIITILAKHNIPILVTSHSPYMIEALKKYSDIEELQNKSNFYLSENEIIEDEDKLQAIYEKLSEPYDDFDKMDSFILNGK